MKGHVLGFLFVNVNGNGMQTSELFDNMTATSSSSSLTRDELTMSQARSGKSYASHVEKAGNRTAWMTVAVYSKIPLAPSKVASDMYAAKGDLAACADIARAAGLGEAIATFPITFELWASPCPNTVDNFINFCNETNSLRSPIIYERQQVPLSYRGTFFHRVVPQFVCQGGDVTRVVNGGANHISSFGKPFNDENLKTPFDAAGLLGMANNGPDSNGSQFFITMSDKEALTLNGRHCCFGRVTSGLEPLMQHLGPYGTDRGIPLRFAVVVDCGGQ